MIFFTPLVGKMVLYTITRIRVYFFSVLLILPEEIYDHYQRSDNNDHYHNNIIRFHKRLW